MNSSSEKQKREQILEILREPQIWDVVIIGGGATGLGSAVEAASRGYKTLLLEKYDFAKGTSSRSTKLVHGGVRYLAQGDIGLVREALHERGLLRQNAPHLVKDLSFVVPGYAWWEQIYYGIGLKLYDLLSGNLSLGHSRFLSESDILERAPTVQQKGLRGGILYHDGQFDDARLAIALMRTFIDHGGTALNYAPVVELIKHHHQVSGVRIQDLETDETLEIKAKVVVNATGIFVDSIRQLDDPNAKAILAPSQGIHLVVDQKFLPGNNAMMIPKTSDGRVLFAVPWHNKVLLGTTDTPIDGPKYEPQPFPEEIDFILKTAVDYLDPAPTREDVLSVFVGIRPLVQEADAESTAEISREHDIRRSDSGLLTITGGKWTTYRKMGEDVGNAIAKYSDLPQKESVTAHLKVHGWTEKTSLLDIDAYGSDRTHIQQLPGSNTPLHPNLPYTEAEVRWAAQREMARTVEDVLARRTRAILLDAAASIEAADRVAEILAEELGHDSAWQQQQIEDYCNLASGYLLKPLPERQRTSHANELAQSEPSPRLETRVRSIEHTNMASANDSLSQLEDIETETSTSATAQ